jgi:protein-S-isoprenylcysteine O-methyltransferase Ste14
VERFGRFLFRWRGVVFPLVIVSLAMAFPPRLAQTSLEESLLSFGLVLILAGQGLRVLTIGWAYIERGGAHGKVSANRLVTQGMYAYCRNPMYLGNILLVGGFLLLFGRVIPGIVGLAFCCFFYAAIVACEEAFLHLKFGEEFAAYRARVPRWGIRLRALRDDMGLRSADVKIILLREYSTLSVTALSALVLTVWRLKGETWSPVELAVLFMASGAILGFYFTMRYLKTRRIVYAPR